MDLFVNVVNTHKNYTQKAIDKNVHSDFILLLESNVSMLNK